MKKFCLFIVAMAFAIVGFSQNHWTESFENPQDTWPGYTTGTITFQESGDWDFLQVYPESSSASYDGVKACRINDDVAGASITSPAVNGAGTVSFYYHKPYSGDGTFDFQISVDGGDFSTLTSVDYSAVTTPTLFSYDVNNESDNLRFRVLNDDNTAHLTIDYFTISQSTGGNANPTITNVMFAPEKPTSTQDVLVTADITDSDGTIAIADLHWGLTAGANTYTIAMVDNGSGNYSATIPAQANQAMVYFEIYAEDNEGGNTTTTEYSYLVKDPAMTTIPYFEPFDTDLGDCLTHSVSGDSKEWMWTYDNGKGVASMNGYNSGVLEEDWLILPGVNLDDYDGEALMFDSWYKYGTDDADNYLKVMYSTDYPGTGDPSGYTWTELAYTQPASAESWESSGKVDLTAISGDKVYIAFKYNYASGSYRYWKVDNVNILPSCDGTMTVYLKDSEGNLQSGGSLQYKDGGWQTASEIADGVFCVDTDKANIDLKMNFCEADLYVSTSTTECYVFQTVLVTFELRKRTGDLGYNHGQIFYQGFGGLLATTGDNGLGLAQKELLPREYTFRMKFRGGLGDITQDITVDPVVSWQMARMLVQINKSDGTRGLNGADIKYKGSSLEHFGVTGTSENGRARKDLLPGFYKFTIKYLGGKQVVEDFEVSLGDNELIIDGIATTVELLESGTNDPVDGARVNNIGVASNLMGYTGDSGSGIVTVDLLPVIYGFEVTLDGDQDTQYDIDVTTTPWITFYTDDLKSAELGSADGISVSVFPNPFVSNTTFGVSLEEDQNVNISIYDITGKQIATLYEGHLQQGSHKLGWNASEVPDGMYIYRMTTDTGTYTEMIVKN